MGTITMASEEYDAMVAERDQLKAELDDPFRLARHSKRLVEQLSAENGQLKAENEQLRKSCAGVIARSVQGDGWIPVSERLPEYGQEVIVNADFDGVCAGVLDSYD